MPVCPECDHSEEPTGAWLTEILDDEKRHRGRTICLITCPNCDAVLGGTDSEWVAAY